MRERGYVMREFVDYYELLEVSQRASIEVIERAYRVLIKRWHPDTNMKSDSRLCEEKTKLLNEAIEILSDNDLRAKYDEQLNKFYKSNNSEEDDANQDTYSNQSTKDSSVREEKKGVSENGTSYRSKYFKKAIFSFSIIILIFLISSGVKSLSSMTSKSTMSTTPISTTNHTTTQHTSYTTTEKTNDPSITEKYYYTPTSKPSVVTSTSMSTATKFTVNYYSVDKEAYVKEIEIIRNNLEVEIKFTIYNNTKYYIITSPVIVYLYNSAGVEIGRSTYFAASADPKKYTTIRNSVFLKYGVDNEIHHVRIDFSIESRI